MIDFLPPGVDRAGHLAPVSDERPHQGAVVLSDRERKALREVERQFMVHDPEFIRSFQAAGQPSTYSIQWVYELPWWAYRIAIGLAVALALLMILAASPWTAVMFAGLAALFWRIQKCGSEPGRRDT